MTITATQVKELRELSGAGMMDAKNALTEASGDMTKALEILRQRGIATAEKKSGRTAADGQVFAVIAPDKSAGALVEVNCETDFVAKGEAFLQMVQEVAQYVLDKAPRSIESLTEEKKDYVVEKVAQIKENLTIRRFARYALSNAGLVQSYIHTGGKIGVLLQLNTGKASTAETPDCLQLTKDIAMQIASAAPEFVSRTEIPQSVIDEETRIELGKEDILKKPEEIRGKIVAGRVDKLLAQRVLVEQPFIKDPSVTIQGLLDEKAKQWGDSLTIAGFTRFVLGEGIEKKEANFAEEVMAQLK